MMLTRPVAALISLSLAAPSAVANVRSVSVVPASNRAEVVVGVDAAVEVQDFTLDSPARVVVDLKGATLDMPGSSYDRISRGGVTNVRFSQFRNNVVRIVIELDAVHPYEVRRDANEVRIAITGGGSQFAAWRSGTTAARDAAMATSEATAGSLGSTSDPVPSRLSLVQQPSQQPSITVNFQDTDIRDVIASFATFAGRTIVVGKDVTGTVTAEIRNQPWDIALRAILQGQGLAASEDPSSGIITVDSYRNIATRQSSEPLVTQMISINYANAGSLVGTVKSLLQKDCLQNTSVPESGPAANQSTSCVARGAVAADSATNTLIITETATRLADVLGFVRNLDVRPPQVGIKAKIIFVNRTNIEDIGLSYDLGTGTDQFFSQLVKRTDPSTRGPVDTNGDGVPDALGGGQPFNGDRILLGGNALSAIANANSRVTNPALSVVFSTTLGKFQLTSFLDALQEVRLADLQAEPSVVTLDNRAASILVGQEIPIRVLDASTANTGGATTANQVPRATVQLKEVGIILTVTPHITNNRMIRLEIHAENSDAQLASSDVGFIFGKQRGDTQLLVADGETAVIGGLTVTQTSQSKSGIPILVDLPLIGRLFGETRTADEKRDLLILVTPHIIDNGDKPTVSFTPPPSP
ncbi:MAG: AMIN domain-containing protein [Gemmatimonadota bacterium]|nr:AMIN domain-containing protein [Gemmatimonadota bacterium]